jgi:hypothetical protein
MTSSRLGRPVVRQGLLVVLAALAGGIAGRYWFPHEPIVVPMPQQALARRLSAGPEPNEAVPAHPAVSAQATQKSGGVTDTDEELDAGIVRSDVETQAARESAREARLAFYNARLADAGHVEADSTSIARELSSQATSAEFQGSEIGDVRCAGSLCRIEVQSQDSKSGRQLTKLPTQTGAFIGGQAFTLSDVQEDGRVHTTIFASRTGHELPDPEN